MNQPSSIAALAMSPRTKRMAAAAAVGGDPFGVGAAAAGGAGGAAADDSRWGIAREACALGDISSIGADMPHMQRAAAEAAFALTVGSGLAADSPHWDSPRQHYSTGGNASQRGGGEGRWGEGGEGGFGGERLGGAASRPLTATSGTGSVSARGSAPSPRAAAAARGAVSSRGVTSSSSPRGAAKGSSAARGATPTRSHHAADVAKRLSLTGGSAMEDAVVSFMGRVVSTLAPLIVLSQRGEYKLGDFEAAAAPLKLRLAHCC